MATNDNELLDIDEQLKQLQKRRNSIIAEKKKGVIEEVKEKIKQYGITLKELGYTDSQNIATEGNSKHNKSKGKMPLKYKNVDGDKQWSGHGRKPNWVNDALAEGYSLDDLLIDKPETTE